MQWKFFVGAAILTCGLLFKIGAPIGPLALGVGLAAALNWRRLHP
jgi:hypothetical protein